MRKPMMHEVAETHEGGDKNVSGMIADPEAGLCVEVVSPKREWLALLEGDAFGRARDALAQCIADCGGRDSMGIVALQLFDDAGMQDLNKTYRGKDKPTNVLAFPDGNSNGGGGGDIALGMETLLREARESNIPPADHMIHLLVHAMLHLLGHDHVDEDEAAVMESLESKILAQSGIADPHKVSAGDAL